MRSARHLRPASCQDEVTPLSTIPVSRRHNRSWPCSTSAAGTSSTTFSHCSTTELRRLSPPAGFEPAAHGFDVARAFTTPQTNKKSFTPPDTPPRDPIRAQHRCALAREPKHPCETQTKSGRNPRSRDTGFEPVTFRPLPEVTVNFTIPGKTKTPIPRTYFSGSKRLRLLFYFRAIKQSTGPANLVMRSVCLSCSCPICCSSRSVRTRRQAGVQLR
jgi:hypothetical protein